MESTSEVNVAVNVCSTMTVLIIFESSLGVQRCVAVKNSEYLEFFFSWGLFISWSFLLDFFLFMVFARPGFAPI